MIGTACVVVPTQVYVAAAGFGTPVYERCSLTPALPQGIQIERDHLVVVVSVASEPRSLVKVQFDIPEGMTVKLQTSTIQVDSKDGMAPRLAPIAGINPLAPAQYPETAVMQKFVLPPDAPMRGGRLQIGKSSSDKHYWLAAPLDSLSSDNIWITLPALWVDGVPTKFEAFHFARRLTIGVGIFNC